MCPQKTAPKGHTKLQPEKLKQLIEERPDAYLDELAVELNVSAFTIAYGLQRLGISRKKTTLYAERIEEERNKFKQVLETLNPADLVYIDECGLQESLWREYARSPIGERILTDIPGKRESRTSIIAGLHQGKPLAPMMFDGYCNTEVVKEWAKEMLLPELKPGQIVIWDNASFHQSPQFTLSLSIANSFIYRPILLISTQSKSGGQSSKHGYVGFVQGAWHLNRHWF